MNYSLGNMLGGGFVGGLDPDAKGYIDAVTATGTSVSGTQRVAINNFYKTSKLSGDYTSLKRLYLPIWASASANAIDMIGLTSGTFNGSVTHAAGYIQGDGVTGYFDTLSTDTAMGISPLSCSIGVLSFLAPTILGVAIGSQSGATPFSLTFAASGSNNASLYLNNSALSLLTQNGVLIASRTSATANAYYQRKTAGFTTPVTGVTTSIAGTLANGFKIYGLARSFSNTANSFTNYRAGALIIGTGITTAQATSLTLSIKNLWEGATGLTLP
jgi:hypothetical protein